MNGILGHLCVYVGLTEPGKHPEDDVGLTEPGKHPEDGEMNEMTLHAFQAQNSKYEPWRSDGEHATFLEWLSGVRTRDI